MWYYQSKFVCTRTRSSEDIAEIVLFGYISPCCDLHIEDSEPGFVRNIPPHNTPPYQVRLKTVDIVRTKSDSRTEGQTDRRTR